MFVELPLFHASVLSFQNGLMLKITETCPEPNCTLAEQILPDGRCCNVCRGTSPCTLEPLARAHHSLLAGAKSKHIQFGVLRLHLVCMLLGLITQPSRRGCWLRSSRYVNLAEPPLRWQGGTPV